MHADMPTDSSQSENTIIGLPCTSGLFEQLVFNLVLLSFYLWPSSILLQCGNFKLDLAVKLQIPSKLSTIFKR